MMLRPCLARFAATLSLFALFACNRGSTGSLRFGSGDLSLQSVEYGRLVIERGQEKVVSPLSTVARDPATGQMVPGSAQPLDPSIKLNTLVDFGLGPAYVPRVVPRNAVLILTFSRQLDPASVFADTLDPTTGAIVNRGSVQVRHQKQPGQPVRGVPVELTVQGKQLWINPVTAGSVGFPPSPVDFDAAGEPRADATGHLRLAFDAKRLLSTKDGTTLVPRADGLGDRSSPIGFNPGNQVLDFIAADDLFPTNETFHGFLPDLVSPRVIRSHTYDGTFDVAAGDSAGPSRLTDLAARFSMRARMGNGEWSGATLTLRPGQGDEEVLAIQSNSAQSLYLSGSFAKAPRDGDAFQLSRIEFFEPDPADPIDPARFDPDNPENGNNANLSTFLRAFELDSLGNRVGPALDVLQPLPAFSELVLRFNEPISEDSLGAWESFRIRENPYLGPGVAEKVARLASNADQTEVAIQPIREDPAAGSIEVVGWGPGIQSLTFEITTAPRVSRLQDVLSGADLQAYLDRGIRAIQDLAGQPLAFPDSQFDPSDPAVVSGVALFTDEAISSSNPPPASQDWGAIVHRFQGRPITGIDPASGNPGVAFVDHVDMYQPIADVNLAVYGFLAGQPVTFVTKIHDDFFPPPDGSLNAFPLGASAPLSSYFSFSEQAPWEHNGARFQHVYRDVDASPGRDSLAGTLLDLVRVSFAPIGGNVTTDVYQDISVHAAHAYARPNTEDNGAGAVDPFFALNEAFDFDSYWDVVVSKKGTCPSAFNYQCPNVYDESMVTTVPAGTTWTVTQSNLYTPPFDGNAYHPWPDFTTPFQYNNGGFPQEHLSQQKQVNRSSPKWPWTTKRNLGPDGDSLLLEYRVRPQATPISRQNGFTFSPAILIAMFPYFRVNSLGTRASPLNPDDTVGEQRARCATPTPGSGASQYGDNSRYFAVFDYEKTTSIIQSPFVLATGATTPDYFPPTVEPPLSPLPVGTSVTFQYAGTDRTDGQPGTLFGPDQDVADGYQRIAFQVSLVGDTTSLVMPSLDLVMIPFLR